MCCHHVPLCSRKTHWTKYHSIKSLENETWYKSDICKLGVRNYNGHFSKPTRQAHKNAGMYTQNLVSKSKSKNYAYSFLWRKAVGKPTGVPLWRPSRTTSGTRTTAWEPLIYMENVALKYNWFIIRWLQNCVTEVPFFPYFMLCCAHHTTEVAMNWIWKIQ